MRRLALAIALFTGLIAAFLVPAPVASAAVVETLYGAETSGPAGTSSTLYVLDPEDGSVIEEVGDIGFAVTGLAIDPATGALFGSTTAADDEDPGSLISIDRETGAGTLIGAHDDETTPTVAPDITFFDGELFGWIVDSADREPEDLGTIDTGTGVATIVGESGITNTVGNGMTAFEDTILLAPQGEDGNLYNVDPATGAATVRTALDGSGDGQPISALSTSCAGEVFGARVNFPGGPPPMGPPTSTDFLRIDPDTGEMEDLGDTVNGLSALAFDCFNNVTTGYRMVAADGGIFTFGDDRNFHGSTGAMRLNRPIVGGATVQDDFDGYWIVADDGGVFAFNVEFHGSLANERLPAPAVEIEPSATGKGYWIVLANGKVHAFGDAEHFGDMSTQGLNRPVIGMSVTPTGKGYWLVAQDGGIFSFGDAEFHGSTGNMTLNQPVIDLAPTSSGDGYYLVARDGGVFSFGDAVFHGSTGAMRLNQPVVAALVTPRGYWLGAADGGVFAFGDAPFLGSMGAVRLNAPVLDMIN